MTELDSLDQTLQQLRTELSPSPADKARLRVALGLSPRPPLAPSSAVVPSSWRALRASGKAGLLMAALLASVNFGGGYWFGRTRPALEVRENGPRSERAEPVLPPHGVRLEATPVPLVADAPPSAPIAPSPIRAADPPARAPRSRSRTPSPPSSPNDELALLRRVERALRAADPALAVALIGELDERFAETSLGEERQAARVMAHCGLEEPGARLRAERFLSDLPSSVYSGRVRSACGLLRRGEGSSAFGDQ